MGLIAARRDASWFAHPGRASLYHAVVDRPGGRGRGPACGVAMHDEDTEESASGLLESEKCQRPGCKQAFAKDQQQGGRADG